MKRVVAAAINACDRRGDVIKVKRQFVFLTVSCLVLSVTYYISTLRTAKGRDYEAIEH